MSEIIKFPHSHGMLLTSNHRHHHGCMIQDPPKPMILLTYHTVQELRLGYRIKSRALNWRRIGGSIPLTIQLQPLQSFWLNEEKVLSRMGWGGEDIFRWTTREDSQVVIPVTRNVAGTCESEEFLLNWTPLGHLIFMLMLQLCSPGLQSNPGSA